MRYTMFASLVVALAVVTGCFPQGLGQPNDEWADFESTQAATKFPQWGNVAPEATPKLSTPCLDEYYVSPFHWVLTYVTSTGDDVFIQFRCREVGTEPWIHSSPWQGIDAGDAVPCSGRWVLASGLLYGAAPGITVEVQMRAKYDGGKAGDYLECGTVVLDNTPHFTCGANDCNATWNESE